MLLCTVYAAGEKGKSGEPTWVMQRFRFSQVPLGDGGDIVCVLLCCTVAKIFGSVLKGWSMTNLLVVYLFAEISSHFLLCHLERM